MTNDDMKAEAVSLPVAVVSFGQAETVAARLGWSLWLASLPASHMSEVIAFEPWRRYRLATTEDEILGFSRVYDDAHRGVVVDILTRRYECRGVKEVLGAMGCVRPGDIEEATMSERSTQ